MMTTHDSPRNLVAPCELHVSSCTCPESTPTCDVQIAEAETKKYEEAQQSEQGAFQASIVDLEQAVASMQSCTDMSAATAVAEEVRQAAMPLLFQLLIFPSVDLLLVSLSTTHLTHICVYS